MAVNSRNGFRIAALMHNEKAMSEKVELPTMQIVKSIQANVYFGLSLDLSESLIYENVYGMYSSKLTKLQITEVVYATLIEAREIKAKVYIKSLY